MKDGKGESVCYKGVPAYADYTDADLAVPGLGTIKVDVAYGGNYFIFFSAEEVDLRVSFQNIKKIVETGQRIKQAANEQFVVQHPELKRNNLINVATILAKPNNSKAIYRNVHVLGSLLTHSLGGTGARSPGGTGMGALMAVLHAKGELGLNQEIWVESITEGLFKGQLLAETNVMDRKGVIPEITGSAYITGFHQFIIDQEDRLKDGFLIQ
jgi:proline racemase